ncbi:MAG: flagellar hook-associated protein FlgL [Methylobacter tundripaludum]|nr:flagellar hook-associated protein FlgL [Methylobacter tundripaludum]
MRISTAWAQQLNVNAMAGQQAKLAKVQQQLSTGLKVSTPADDPAAAVKVLDLQATIAQTTQYQSNISTARGRLNIEESALASSANILSRAKELTLQGKNDSLNSNDRLALKFEIDQLIQEMAGVANTKNANGEFIFSGDFSTVPAFALHPTTGEYVYQGGPQQRVLQISPTRQVADGDLGFNVFENINSTSPGADENGKRSIFNTLKSLSDGLAGTFKATPAQISGDRFLRYGLDYSDPLLPPTKFELVGNIEMLPATAPPSVIPLPAAQIDLSGKAFANTEDVVTEINAQLSGAAGLLPAAFVAPNTNLPAGSHYSDVMQARSNGNRIEFGAVTTYVSEATGVNTSIKINNTSGTFLTDAGFVDGQSNTGVDVPGAATSTSQIFQDQLDGVLNDLDAALNSFLEARTSVGARLNALDNQEAQNEKFVLDTKTTLSETQDLDYADAISRFQLQSTALQVAQQTYAQVSGLSLFKYL